MFSLCEDRQVCHRLKAGGDTDWKGGSCHYLILFLIQFRAAGKPGHHSRYNYTDWCAVHFSFVSALCYAVEENYRKKCELRRDGREKLNEIVGFTVTTMTGDDAEDTMPLAGGQIEPQLAGPAVAWPVSDGPLQERRGGKLENCRSSNSCWMRGHGLGLPNPPRRLWQPKDRREEPPIPQTSTAVEQLVLSLKAVCVWWMRLYSFTRLHYFHWHSPATAIILFTRRMCNKVLKEIECTY